MWSTPLFFRRAFALPSLVFFSSPFSLRFFSPFSLPSFLFAFFSLFFFFSFFVSPARHKGGPNQHAFSSPLLSLSSLSFLLSLLLSHRSSLLRLFLLSFFLFSLFLLSSSPSFSLSLLLSSSFLFFLLSLFFLSLFSFSLFFLSLSLSFFCFFLSLFFFSFFFFFFFVFLEKSRYPRQIATWPTMRPPQGASIHPTRAAKNVYARFQGFTSSSVHSIVFSRQAVPCRRSCVSFVATSARKARQILPSIG